MARSSSVTWFMTMKWAVQKHRALYTRWSSFILTREKRDKIEGWVLCCVLVMLVLCGLLDVAAAAAVCPPKLVFQSRREEKRRARKWMKNRRRKETLANPQVMYLMAHPKVITHKTKQPRPAHSFFSLSRNPVNSRLRVCERTARWYQQPEQICHSFAFPLF